MDKLELQLLVMLVLFAITGTVLVGTMIYQEFVYDYAPEKEVCTSACEKFGGTFFKYVPGGFFYREECWCLKDVPINIGEVS